MDEVAALAEHAGALREEDPALLRLVLRVHLLVLPQLVRPVRELAALLVGAAAELQELLAELRLLLLPSRRGLPRHTRAAVPRGGGVLGGGGVAGLLGQGLSWQRLRHLAVTAQHALF